MWPVRSWVPLRLSAMLVGVAAGVMPALAQKPASNIRVDLALILAVDASRSIDDFEYRLQRVGYARALRHPAVLRAITSGEHRRIALTYVEWSSHNQFEVLVPWRVIDGAASAARFAQALLAASRRLRGPTSISTAIDLGVAHFGDSGVRATRRAIDISGDGPNNRGRPSAAARDDAVRQGITINGLAIVNDRPSRPPWREEAVDRHYRRSVIGGPGAFLIVVKGFGDFGRAVRLKLVREISGRPGPDVLVLNALRR